jgi:hypothetical protein
VLKGGQTAFFGARRREILTSPRNLSRDRARPANEQMDTDGPASPSQYRRLGGVLVFGLRIGHAMAEQGERRADAVKFAAACRFAPLSFDV